MYDGLYSILDTAPVKVDVGAASVASAALNAKKVMLISPVGAYFSVGAAPVAVADPAQSFYLPADVPFTISLVRDTDKVAAIQKDASGWLQIVKLA